MKKILVGVVVAMLFIGCARNPNANLNVNLDSATVSNDKVSAEILYTAYSFQIQRVTINGVSYICSSKGGIVKE